MIHGEIYKARPDVNAVAHHHGMAFLPFCNSGEELLPLYHMGAQIGEKVPFWDSRDEFGDTYLLVLKPEEGRSLAKALGPHWLRADAPPRRDGGGEESHRTGVPHHLQLPQRRASAACARRRAMTLSPLTPGEAKMAWDRNLEPRPQARAWEYWLTRLKKAGEYPKVGRKR